jgi:hypothetical protein
VEPYGQLNLAKLGYTKSVDCRDVHNPLYLPPTGTGAPPCVQHAGDRPTDLEAVVATFVGTHPISFPMIRGWPSISTRPSDSWLEKPATRASRSSAWSVKPQYTNSSRS